MVGRVLVVAAAPEEAANRRNPHLHRRLETRTLLLLVAARPGPRRLLSSQCQLLTFASVYRWLEARPSVPMPVLACLLSQVKAMATRPLSRRKSCCLFSFFPLTVYVHVLCPFEKVHGAREEASGA